MKFLFALLALLLLPMSLARAEDKTAAIEACKSKASFKYHFDMMKIEGDEIRGSVSHREAAEKKSERHKAHQEELEECADL